MATSTNAAVGGEVKKNVPPVEDPTDDLARGLSAVEAMYSQMSRRQRRDS
jgi:hypothetical protein